MDTAATVILGYMEQKRVRMIFDCDEELRRAIRFRCARAGKSPSEVIVDVLRSQLTRELEEAREALAAEDGAPPHRKKREGKS